MKILLPLLTIILLSFAADAGLVMKPTGGGGGGAVFALVNQNFNSTTSNVSALSANIGTATAGHLFVVLLRGYNPPSTHLTGTTITTAPSTGMTCTHATGAFVSQGAADLAPMTDIWYCLSSTASGSITFNAAYASTGTFGNNVNTPQMVVAEFSGNASSSVDGLVGNTASSSSGTVSLSTSGAVPQTNDLVVSMVTNTVSNPTAVGSGQTLFSTDTSIASSFQTISSGTATHTYTNSAQMYSASIAAFKHP